ncbi:MAG: hypothetical protein MJA29_04140 [Candidatus Omnitrophica bacterium]|nr:hypothetical protein [Candidatus Omnitrophota bacterium]
MLNDRISCKACGMNFHAKCANISTSIARLIDDASNNLSYLCDTCHTSIPNISQEMNSLKDELSNLKDQFANSVGNLGSSDNFDHRLNILEQKLDNFMQSFDMESLLTRISSHIAEAVASATSTAIFESMKEFAELDKKKNNVVIFNLNPVSDTTDQELVISMLNNAGLSTNDDSIENCWRDGPSFPNKSRLLKVKFKDYNLRQKCLSSARAKKFPSPIFIRKDMTFKERMARKKAAKEHIDNGSYLRDVNIDSDIFNTVSNVNFNANSNINANRSQRRRTNTLN